MSKLAGVFKNIGRLITGAVTTCREKLESTFNNLRRDKSIGELEQRFSPRRVLGGFMLARTGKHRGTKIGPRMATVAPANPPGSKLWRKALEGKL